MVVERRASCPIEGIVRLDSELDEYDDKLGGAFPRHMSISKPRWCGTGSEETTKLLREFLGKKIKPAAPAQSDSRARLAEGGKG